MLHTNQILSAIFYFLGYSAGVAGFFWMARQRNMATDGIAYLLAAGLLGGLIGANIAQYLYTGLPGKTIIGGIACGYLSVIAVKHALGIKRPTGDLFAIAISLGEAIGRWGCFFGGCCFGKTTTVLWAVYQDGARRHPTQAYDSIANALILVILLKLLKRELPENTLFYVQGSLYCVARFAIEYFRDSPVFAFGMTLAQWVCVAGFLFFTSRLGILLWPKEASVAIREPMPEL